MCRFLPCRAATEGAEQSSVTLNEINAKQSRIDELEARLNSTASTQDAVVEELQTRISKYENESLNLSADRDSLRQKVEGKNYVRVSFYTHCTCTKGLCTKILLAFMMVALTILVALMNLLDLVASATSKEQALVALQQSSAATEESLSSRLQSVEAASKETAEQMQLQIDHLQAEVRVFIISSYLC